MWQTLLVTLIVVAAAAYALWYGLPQRWRGWLARIHPALRRRPGCGACDGCSGCDKPR
jgi:hypothetical protein